MGDHFGTRTERSTSDQSARQTSKHQADPPAIAKSRPKRHGRSELGFRKVGKRDDLDDKQGIRKQAKPKLR